MDNYILSERFAKMWTSSRIHAGKSQEYMARALGVSRKTIQNWESGESCPSQLMGFKWFTVLNLQPLPYYLELLYPLDFGMEKRSDQDAEQQLLSLIKVMPADYQRKLLYLLNGEHGSSAVCVLDMITADLQTPLRDRLNVAANICTNYEIAQATGKIRNPNDIQPNMDLLRLGIQRGKEAVLNNKDEYTAIL